jgi:mercuric ion binding protein
MKTVASIVVIMIAIMFAPAKLSGQKAKLDTIQIKTSAECEMCKAKLEKEVGVMKGVKSVNLDLTTQVATVVYNGTKTEPAKIRTVIANTGYDADDVKANNRAQKKLPACCKPGGMPAADSVPK